jgi:hypothetical protein
MVKQKEEGENMKESLKETSLLTPQQAKLAWANGEEVEYYALNQWCRLTGNNMLSTFEMFDKFRIKPRTIKIELDIPAPFEPKDGYPVWFIDDNSDCGYSNSWEYGSDIYSFYGFWRSEEEIKQVVAALKSALDGDKE